jgi:hypothetical protein
MPITRSLSSASTQQDTARICCPCNTRPRGAGPSVVPASPPNGPAGQSDAGDRVDPPRATMNLERLGRPCGRRRSCGARIDRAAEDRNDGNQGLSRPALDAPDDAPARSPWVTSGRLSLPSADARLGRPAEVPPGPSRCIRCIGTTCARERRSSRGVAVAMRHKGAVPRLPPEAEAAAPAPRLPPG